jgi:hypothetical protein
MPWETGTMPFLKSTQEQLQDRRDDSETGYAVVHVDTCLSCYVQDHHHRDGELLLGVYVDGTSTVGGILHDLALELNQTNLEEGERGGFVYDKASAAIAKLREDNSDRLDQLFAPGAEVPADDEDDGSDPCYAWFVITWNVPEEAS